VLVTINMLLLEKGAQGAHKLRGFLLVRAMLGAVREPAMHLLLVLCCEGCRCCRLQLLCQHVGLCCMECSAT
jgi:hypothetical protein